MMLSWQIIWIGTVAFLSQIDYVTSHGRLKQPAQRSSAWRYGFDNPPNYNDMELFCGGFGVQWNPENDGRCGVCGDPFNAAVKPNEDVDGKYVVNGVITGSYFKGDVMETKVQLTAYHKGWFEFRLCPLATPDTKVTQECLNQTLLKVAGSNISRVILEDIKVGSTGSGIYTFNLQLPSSITCERCVLQWKYNTGNSNGCESKGCCIGCGKQENFVNCADIKITDVQSTTGSSSSVSQSATMTALTSSTTLQSSTSSVMSSTSSSTSTPSTTTSATTTTTTTSTATESSSALTTNSQTSSSQSSSSSTAAATTTTGSTMLTSTSGFVCTAVYPYSNIPGITAWCYMNCPQGYCPPTHCQCSNS
ncbi:uncharacterized protein LOC123542162 [Mercenaria mercenaria]|uniref:uncharacterized protein LOC123542162 n=1 Tax=Mercenaria mercenaria TaxID=6596 RepID=UPI00234E61E3|nr:uncharacterized protein LOC123542162 [Mercenaria mercenaria]